MKQFKIIALLTIFILTSCSPIYFYQSTRDRVENSSKQNIEKIQFFNDRKITVVHKTASQDESIAGGKVKFQDGYYYYYIEFPKKTPAIAKDWGENNLKVYFESGADRYLYFGRSDEKSSSSTYQLFGQSEDDSFYIDFESKKFKVIEGSGAKLIIKKNIKTDVQSDKRKVKGVKVN